MSHRTLIVTFTLLSKLFYFFVLQLSSKLPLFDASPLLLSVSHPLRPFLRWDAFHFLHVAQHGYVYEHEWAFFPGSPLVMRYSAAVIGRIAGESVSDFLLGGFLAALACDTSWTLYTLSLPILQSSNLALLATLLSLIPTSPVTLYFAPYSEPFFTYFSYRGMLCCNRQQWFYASLCFAIAGMFRSNAIFLAGFIIWGLLVQPLLDRKMPGPKPIRECLAYTTIVFTPFVYHHYAAYVAFCSTPESTAEWCSRMPPSIYTYVQSKYWNSGFLLYWTMNQLPNFLIAAPTLALMSVFAASHLLQTRPKAMHTAQTRRFANPSLVPYAIHTIVLCFILLFASHTQIVLRLAASMPLVYWAAAWLVSEHPLWGSWWVSWSFLWSIESVVLWGAFLPPA
ncbi:glycosyltransferase family 76 protein [Crassisporium funariophilum]|nr:glycosyltransferase family 76 protein [Crassisporium funariophilum]